MKAIEKVLPFKDFLSGINLDKFDKRITPFNLFDMVLFYLNTTSRNHIEENFSRSNRGMKDNPEYDYDFSISYAPWFGNIINSKVYLLYLNPTPEWVKYDEDPLVSSNCSSLLESCRFHQLTDERLPGHRRWRTLFKYVQEQSGLSWEEMSKKICIVNLVPFASHHFSDNDMLYRSNTLTKTISLGIRKMVEDEDKLFIVCRKPEIWKLPGFSNVITFSPIQRRGIHLKQKGLDLTYRISDHLCRR
jgi:hypothetical protein